MLARRERVPRGSERRLVAQRGDIRRRIAFGERRQSVGVNVGRQGLAAQLVLEKTDPGRMIRWRHVEEAIKPPGAQQSRVEGIRPVCRAYNHDPFEFFHAVHLGEKLGKDLRARSVLRPACPGQRVNFVKEQHTRRRFARPVKHLAELGLGLASHLP